MVAGAGTISDALGTITSGRAAGELVRTAESFFQANRYLLPELVSTVIDAVLAEGDVLDLYSGVGLFSVALAGTGRGGIVAVEGNPLSGNDLVTNARAQAPRISAVVQSVESHIARLRTWPPTVIVDPPRTGLSKAVLAAIAGAALARVIYVSCDPPTLARDSRGLLDSGYRLRSIRAFDLFPNTPHVEAIAVFDR
jgi:23S rRNA (uracil1939-C5)-methyltransferase